MIDYKSSGDEIVIVAFLFLHKNIGKK